MHTLYGHEIVGQQTLYQQGCFRRVKYWLRGHVKGFVGLARYIHGLTGPETEVIIDSIYPTTSTQYLEPTTPVLSETKSPGVDRPASTGIAESKSTGLSVVLQESDAQSRVR